MKKSVKFIIISIAAVAAVIAVAGGLKGRKPEEQTTTTQSASSSEYVTTESTDESTSEQTSATETFSSTSASERSTEALTSQTEYSEKSTAVIISAPKTTIKTSAKVTSKKQTVSRKASSPKYPTYINGILIANKSYALPSDYNPGVDPNAQKAFSKMASEASKEGISLRIVSGFRSYSTQQSIYNNYVASDGKAEADRYSARPGHSEHQTGLAFDVNSLSQSFENTPEGKWLAANCHKYGFIIRYPKGKENVTGYMYEPWHIRYLGTGTAEDVFVSGLTLEEYLGISSVYAN